MEKNVRIVYSIDIFDMDFIKHEQEKKTRNKLIQHIQKSNFLQEIKTKISENPDNYKNIIDTAKISASTLGHVMDGAALIEWEKLTKEELIDLFHDADSPKSSSDDKKQKAAKVLQRNIGKFANKQKTSKLQSKQKQNRLEEAVQRRKSATRKVKSRTSRVSQALEVLRSQREQSMTPTVLSRYSKGVLVSSTHKVGKNKLGGNKKRHTMKKQRK